jgi:hypothetical protein
MAWLEDAFGGGGAAVGTALLPGVGTVAGGFIGNTIGGLFGGGGDSVDVSSLQVRYALEHATAAERAWLYETLAEKEQWRTTHNIHALSDAAVEELVVLIGGGHNQRYNSTEKRIRDRSLTLLQRYPYGSVQPAAAAPASNGDTYQWGGAPAAVVTSPPPPTYTDAGGSNWWEALSAAIRYDKEGGLQVGAGIDNKAQQINSLMYAGGAILVVLVLLLILKDR